MLLSALFMSEHAIQSAFVTWCKYQERFYPMLQLSFATPNAAKRSIGLAMRMKKEGLKSGVLDWCLPYNNGKYNGLWIEFKYGSNTLTDNQEAYGLLLEKYGHDVHVCYNVDDAINIVKEYLK